MNNFTVTEPLKALAQSSLTVTITSTNGWESLLFKKPVITFGEVFFNDVPGVERCRSYEDLAFQVQKQLNSWRYNEQVLIDYISALLEDSVVVDFSALWNRAATFQEALKDQGMQDLSHKLTEKIWPGTHA